MTLTTALDWMTHPRVSNTPTVHVSTHKSCKLCANTHKHTRASGGCRVLCLEARPHCTISSPLGGTPTARTTPTPARERAHTHTHTHFAHTAVSGPLVILGQQSMPLQHSLCWVGPETWRHLVTWELFAWYLRVACIRLGLPHITPLPQHTTPNPNLCLGGTHACPPARNVTAASGQQHGLMHSTAGHAVQPATTQADITA
jgi:hypothetical protein